MGLLGGLLFAWSPRYTTLFSTHISFGIVVDLEDHFFNSTFRLVNVYGPYVDEYQFREGLSGSGFLSSSNIILEGDLNFTVSIREVYGAHPCK